MIGGEAGFGIMSSGELLAKCLTHGGLWIDVGTPERLLQLNRLLDSRKAE